MIAAGSGKCSKAKVGGWRARGTAHTRRRTSARRRLKRRGAGSLRNRSVTLSSAAVTRRGEFRWPRLDFSEADRRFVDGRRTPRACCRASTASPNACPGSPWHSTRRSREERYYRNRKRKPTESRRTWAEIAHGTSRPQSRPGRWPRPTPRQSPPGCASQSGPGVRPALEQDTTAARRGDQPVGPARWDGRCAQSALSAVARVKPRWRNRSSGRG